MKKKVQKQEQLKEEKDRLKIAGWAVGLLVWVGVSIVAAQYVVALAMIMILGEAINEPVWVTVYTGLAYALTAALVILVPWGIFRKNKARIMGTEVGKVSREELGLAGLPTWADILLSPIGFIVYMVIAALLAAAFMQFSWFDFEQVQDTGFANLGGMLDKIVAFIALVVLAPIAEEVVFRGWLYGKMRFKVNVWVSIFFVSALFGLMHGQWNVGVNVFAMSVVMCALREVTGTIYAGILLHMLKNGIAFYLLFVNPIS